MITFTVLGHPEPAGSKKAYVVNGRAVIVDANPKAKGWKKLVAEAAKVAMTRDPYLGPVSMEVVFFAERPKSHYRTGKFSNEIKPSSPAFPSSRPDALKLARGTEDAMTGIVYKDDGQVVTQTAMKRYGTPERAEIYIRLLGESA